MEKAIAVVADNGVGFEDSDTSAVEFDTTDDGVTDVTGDYDIYARAKELSWKGGDDECTSLGPIPCYLTPMPGTGDAYGGDCDEELWDEDADHACNWNRITTGESVTFPLFYYNDSGVLVNSFTDSSVDSFMLRVRAPEDSVMGGRYQLNEEGNAIITWEFNGTCLDSDGVTEFDCYITPVTDGGIETYILEEDINDASADYIVMQSGYYSGGNYTGDDSLGNDDISIINFLVGDYFLYSHLSIDETYFKMTIPNLLETSSGDPIPYLEYQIVTNVEISDNKVLYEAEGRAEGQLGTYVRNLEATQSIGADSVINFVLQN